VWPTQAATDGSAPLTIGVRHAGTDVGEIEVDPTDLQDKDRDLMVLDNLARPAGLALDTVRLTVELRRRAADLQVLNDQLELSNTRIMRARRDEIARLRGEIDQQVTPHIERAEALVSGVILTATASPQPAPLRTAAPEQQHDRLDLALTEVADALESLRTLARGIYPPRLSDAGLAVSLEGWQQRSGIALQFQLTGDEAALRRNGDIESCLYFSLVTVLTALRRPGTTPVVTVSVSPDHVDTVISPPASGRDDRCDNPNTGPNSGRAAAVQAVKDRIEAFDGQLTIEDSPPGSPPDASASAPASTVRLRVPLPAAAGPSAAQPGTAEPGPRSIRVAP
jgi:signal transduction histidine kinase